MKVRVEQDELKRAVGWAARTLPARPANQLHAGIRIEAGSDSIRLTTFDAETAARADVDAVVGEPGEAMVPGRLLADIVKELPRQPVEMLLEGSKIVLTCGRGSFSLPTYQLDRQAEMPTMPQQRGEVDAQLFVDTVMQIQIAASKDDLLPPLTGIRIELTDSHITMVATDRYRLAIRDIPWTPGGAVGELSALVKARQLQDLAHSVETTDERVLVGLGEAEDGRIGFSVAGRELITRVMHGDFPKYRPLLPDSASSHATVGTADLIAAAKRMKIVSERNTPIRLSFADGEVTLRASGIAGGSASEAQAMESIECSLEGDALEIAFNPELLAEGLNAAHGDQVAMSFNGPGKAAIIRPTDGGSSFRYLLMPMRLS